MNQKIYKNYKIHQNHQIHKSYQIFQNHQIHQTHLPACLLQMFQMIVTGRQTLWTILSMVFLATILVFNDCRLNSGKVNSILNNFEV